MDLDCVVLDRAKSSTADSVTLGPSRQYLKHRLSSATIPLERIASGVFTMNPTPGHCQPAQSIPRMPLSKNLDLPSLSSKATVGRNSQFHDLTERDRELLGGIEYRSLKLLLKIVTGEIYLRVKGAGLN